MCLKFIVKYVLVLFNFVFVLAGLAAVGIGVALLLNYDDWFSIELPVELPIDLSQFQIVPIILIGFGIFVFLVSFSGCCGALIMSKCLVVMYSCCLIVLTVMLIYIASTILTQLDYYKGQVENYVDNIFTNPEYNYTFHALETQFKCCGTTGPESYEGITEWLPPTCCEGRLETCYTDPSVVNCLCQIEDAFKDGCSSILGGYFAEILHSVGYIVIIVIIVALVTLVFALCHARSINHKNKKKMANLA